MGPPPRSAREREARPASVLGVEMRGEREDRGPSGNGRRRRRSRPCTFTRRSGSGA